MREGMGANRPLHLEKISPSEVAADTGTEADGV